MQVQIAIGGLGANQVNRCLVAIDDFDLDLENLTARAMLDHLQVMPTLPGLIVDRWAAALSLRRHLTPGLDQRFSVSAFAIGRHWRRGVRVAAFFELLHQLERDFFFGLRDRTPDSEPGVGLQGRPAPEGATVWFLRAPPFSPLWPT